MAGDGGPTGAYRTIGVEEFKVKCLELMDHVAESGDEIVITKDGRPMSRLIPYREGEGLPFGRLQGEIEILDDIVSPMPSSWFQDQDGSGKELF